MDPSEFEKDGAEPGKVVGLALNIRRDPGPGMLEGKYRKCLVDELVHDEIRQEADVSFERPEKTGGPAHFRADFRIDGTMIVEIKSGALRRK